MYNFRKYMIEILVLAVLFTGVALYLKVHEENETAEFITNHLIALMIALALSKLIYTLIKRFKQ